MNYSKFRFTLDIHKHQSQVSVPVMRGDTAVQLYMTLTDGGLPYEIGDSCFAIIIGNKSDGTTFRHPCIIEGNRVIRYDFQADTSDLSGAMLCEIRLYGTNGILTAPCFTIVVDERIPHYDEVVPADAITALDQVFLNEVARVEAEKERAKADKARWEYFASLYYPALDGILALQDCLIGMNAIYRLNEDGESYTCFGALNIEEIVIADAVGDKPVTAIAPYAFRDYDKLRSITIPNNIKTIGKGAFSGCTALEEIRFNASDMADVFTKDEAEKLKAEGRYSDYPFYNVGIAGTGTHLYIGENVRQIPAYLFYSWTEDHADICNLTSIIFAKEGQCTQVNHRAFYDCKKLTRIDIPDSLIYIHEHAFRKSGITDVVCGEASELAFISACTFADTPLKSIIIPYGVTTILNQAFADCRDLQTVRFLGTPTSIGTVNNPTAFTGCTSLTDIYVPWAKGEVANAPWGATSATIHYNSEV